MLQSCARCGRVHKKGNCPQKRETREKTKNDTRRFRSSALWQRTTRIVRDRDDNLCQACLHKTPPIYRGDPLEVHHIEPIRDAWDLRAEPDNGITLCPDDHELAEIGMIDKATLKTWVEEAKKRAGYD